MPDPKSTKQRVYDILEPGLAGGLPSKAVDVFILGLIILNVIAVVVETVGPLSEEYGSVFRTFEIVSIAIFTIEYVLRLWSITASPEFSRPVRGRLRWMVTPMAIIDLAAILPFYLPIRLDLRFLRVLRLLRLFKLGRYSEALGLIGTVLWSRKNEIGIAFFAAIILILMVSSIMYYLERDAQPEIFSSIPAAMWWGITSLTPLAAVNIATTWGRVFGGVVALLGLGLFALPAGILASGFSQELQKRREQEAKLEAEKERTCPHCGRNIQLPPPE